MKTIGDKKLPNFERKICQGLQRIFQYLLGISTEIFNVLNYTLYFEYSQEVKYVKIIMVMKMISYNPFYKTLFEKGITEYNLIFKQGFSANTLHRMKKGEAISTKTLDALCYALDCEISDIIKFEKE